MGRLKSKICLVTGGASGIGLAIAAAFAREGADIILTDRNAEAGSGAAARLGARFEPLDVSSEEDWAALESGLPRAHVVVNNAGVTGFEGGPKPHDPEHAALEDWRAVHRVNLDGVFLGCRYAIRAMKEAGEGSIINMSSASGMMGVPRAAAYASSKAAILNHTRSVALHCAQQGWRIRCNAITPGAVLTPVWEPLLGAGPEREAAMTALTAETPLRRFGTPEEVAAVAVMLASDEAPFMTGTALGIDGGLLAGTAARPQEGA